METSRAAVVATKLKKQFGSFTAVDGIDFEISSGECFGLLGPNGAGKTTTVRMIYCFTPMTAGSLRVLDMDVLTDFRKIKSQIGVCPQEDNLDPDFSVEKNLRVFARYFGMGFRQAAPRIESLLDFAELQGKRKEKVDTLSGGMKRRLLLARALLNQPRLLILDEPTTGLDPQARHMIWERIRDLKRDGVTIILTTHYMEEAEVLCDRLLFIDSGRIIAQGRPKAIIEEHAGREVLEYRELSATQIKVLRDSPFDFELAGSRGLLYGSSVPEAMKYFDPQEGFGNQFILRSSNLEDVFLKLTGRGLRD